MPNQRPEPEAPSRHVVYSRQAQGHLADLYRWIADESGFPNRALLYVSAPMDRCEALGDFPMLGHARDDIRPDLRTVGFRRRAAIAFAVTDEAVEILGVYYGGRDHETLLRTDKH